MTVFLEDHPALVIASAIALAALLVLTTVGLYMRAANASLRPVIFVGVFFVVICVPQVLMHGTAALWPKPKPQLNATVLAGDQAFTEPQVIFGPDAIRARLQDARPVFGAALSGAEVAQLQVLDNGETTVAARFGDEEGARVGATALWEMYSPVNTFSDGVTTWGTRAAVGDAIALQRVGRAVFFWTGSDRSRIDDRIRLSRAVLMPADTRPAWLTAFDDWRTAAGSVVLLVILATGWFFKGAAWAARIDPVGGATRAPVSASELDTRLAALASATPVTSFTRLGDGRWEAVIGYEIAWEKGAYRYVLEFDEPNHRVKALEYRSSRETLAGGYRWQRQRGITFVRAELSIDLQRANGGLVRAIIEAGWAWQPLLFDAPPALAWLTN